MIVIIQYLTSSLTEAEQEIEDITFEFENEELTLEILDQATPGWTINTLRTPCKVSHKFCCEHHHAYFVLSMHMHLIQITRRQVEFRTQLRKVRVAFERPSIPPQEVLKNRIQLNGIKPECCLNIHFNPSMPRTGKFCIATASVFAFIMVLCYCLISFKDIVIIVLHIAS